MGRVKNPSRRMMGVTALQLKRVTALFLAALTAASLLGACGAKGTDSSQISSGRKESSHTILDNSGLSSQQADESAPAAASSINHSQSNTSHQGSSSQQHSSSGSAQQSSGLTFHRISFIRMTEAWRLRQN